ncbi:MAG: hypothetical protein ACRENB_04925 [Gemmatimonadales bacterium]
MPDPILVFVNERPVRMPPGSTARDAVRAVDAALAEALEDTSRPSERPAVRLTDARGLDLPPDAPLHAGAILRVIVSARTVRDEADAHS